jgi:hypothetical protein
MYYEAEGRKDECTRKRDKSHGVQMANARERPTPQIRETVNAGQHPGTRMNKHAFESKQSKQSALLYCKCNESYVHADAAWRAATVLPFLSAALLSKELVSFSDAYARATIPVVARPKKLNKNRLWSVQIADGPPGKGIVNIGQQWIGQIKCPRRELQVPFGRHRTTGSCCTRHSSLVIAFECGISSALDFGYSAFDVANVREKSMWLVSLSAKRPVDQAIERRRAGMGDQPKAAVWIAYSDW